MLMMSMILVLFGATCLVCAWILDSTTKSKTIDKLKNENAALHQTTHAQNEYINELYTTNVELNKKINDLEKEKERMVLEKDVLSTEIKDLNNKLNNQPKTKLEKFVDLFK